LRIADFELPISDCRFRIADCSFEIIRLRIVDADCGSSDCGLPVFFKIRNPQSAIRNY